MAAEMEALQNNLQTALLVYIWEQNGQVLQTMEQMEMLLVRVNGKIPPSLLKDCCEGQEKQHSELTESSNSLSYLHSIRHEQRYMTKRYRSYSRLLGRAIEVSLNMTTGAGGFSIYPLLKVHTVIPYGSPECRHLENLLFSIETGRNFEDDFQTLKNLLTDRKIDPSWAMHDFYSTESVIKRISGSLVGYVISRSTDLQCSRIIEFLLAIWGESGNCDGSLPIDPSCLSFLVEKNVPFMMRLANLGFSFDIDITFLLCAGNTKDKLLILLSKQVPLRQIPENLKLICRQNAAELRQALQEKRILPNELMKGHSALNWAFGWPEGVQILLDHGADPTRGRIWSLTDPGRGYHSSAEILLRAGCYFEVDQLENALKFNGGEKRMTLLANELAARRKKLRSHAENVLPLDLIPDSGGKKLLDGPDCRKLLEVLLDHKTPLPHPFTSDPDQFLSLRGDKTVYHHVQTKWCAEVLYQLGFLDTDSLDWKGNTPLVSLWYNYWGNMLDELTGIIGWHMSKGANLHRSLAWTNESISHILTLAMILRNSCFRASGGDWVHDIRNETYLQELIELGDDFFAPMRVPDGCSCPCSPNGCTAISAVLRELTAELRTTTGCLKCGRIILDFLYKWDESYWQDPRAFIRSLTFNALDLNHTCFANTKKGTVLWRCGLIDDEDLINDENNEEWSLNEFEELLEHLEQKFVERGQPLRDFVPDYWYRCVKGHLLTRHPHDEAHMADARSVGVELEFCGLSVPEWMEACVARKVEEVDDEDGVEKCD